VIFKALDDAWAWVDENGEADLATLTEKLTTLKVRISSWRDIFNIYTFTESSWWGWPKTPRSAAWTGTGKTEGNNPSFLPSYPLIVLNDSHQKKALKEAEELAKLTPETKEVSTIYTRI